MSFHTSETIVSSAVATSGTVTFNYPENTSAGTFAAFGHKIWIDKFQRLLESPSDFTVSFGASNITVTYLGSTSIPVGARLNAQFNVLGADGDLPSSLDGVINNAQLESLIRLNLGSPDTADANGYVVSQDLTSAGVFSTDTTAAAAIAAAALAGTADVPRNVVAAWTGTAVLTVTGTDEYGNTIVESSASGTSFTGKKAFKTVTDVSTSADITGLTVGTGDVLGLPIFIPDASNVLFENVSGSMEPRKSSRFMVHGKISDISTAGQIYIPVPFAGTIKSVYTALNGAIATADATITVKTAGGTVGTITVANAGSAAGDVDSLTASLANTSVAAGGTIEIETDGSSTNAVELDVTVEIELSAAQQLDGTLVVGATAAATATTGDVRGTYDPSAAMDGSTSVELLVSLPDPEYKGLAQYAG